MSSPDAWFMFGFGVLLAVLGGVGIARTVRGLARQRHARSHGQAVPGEIVRLDPRAVSYYGLYQVRPVAGYVLDGTRREAAIANRVGSLEIGSGLDLVVETDDPWSPWAVYGSYLPTSLAASAIYVVIGLAAAGWSLTW